VEMKKK